MTTKDLLREECNSRIELIKNNSLGTEEDEKAVNATCKMIDKLNEMEKLELERKKLENDETNNSIEWEKAVFENKDRKIKNILTGVGLGITAVGFVTTLIYEERGSILSQGGRKMVDRIFHTK